MKLHATFLATASLIALLAAAYAQDAGDAGTGKLKRIQDDFDRDAWSEALLAPDLGKREASYVRMLDEARRSRAARRALEAWAEEPKGELAWTSRLALRELDRTPDPFGAFRSPLARGSFRGAPNSFWSPFEDFDAFGTWDILRDLEDGFGSLDAMQGLPDDADVQSESFRMESGPDGVKVHIKERGDDGDKEQTYEAESLEQLLQNYPELKERIGLDGTFPPQTRERFSELMDRLRGGTGGLLDLGRTPAATVPTDRLGVLMREPSQYSSSVKGIDPGVGLLVERVFPGTIAQALGVERGDILLELDGVGLRSGDDVKRALDARGTGDTVKLLLVDASGRRATRTWTPPSGA